MDRDVVTGHKLVNQYEILEELGRGEHGKVKLGCHIETRQRVAIKIVQRHSKRRRLGKLANPNPEGKVNKEVAILKKARHPNIVSLLEVIDDPNSQKVYIILEYVENGEIVWRKRGLREIVHVDRLRMLREKAGLSDTPAFVEESLQYVRTAQHLRLQREKARERRQAHAATVQQFHIPAWSLEHGAESDEDDDDDDEYGPEIASNHAHDHHHEGSHDSKSSRKTSPLSNGPGIDPYDQEPASTSIEGDMYDRYEDDPYERRFSSASSNLEYAPSEPEWQSDDDDMSYVPCLTIAEARNAFRDAVLGIEYLHYQGIIHRDIKPANLLMTSDHQIKISDFGVSYIGRPNREEDDDRNVTESEASEFDDARELSKTVGTPAFYAPELCYTGDDFVNSVGGEPKITGAIDIWSLGVTLYGMVFGRLPFISDDEYSMFQNIVKKDIFVPRKRLKPVQGNSQQARNANSGTRMEDALEYESVDYELYDLLNRILTKDPVKRITLKEIKHHPWVLHGLPNPRAWVEDTDPGYQSKGKRIEVSNEEVTTAVSKVPLFQRFRSNFARFFGLGKDKEKDKNNKGTQVPESPSSTSWRRSSPSESLWDGHRFSLKNDDVSSWRSRWGRLVDHPLSQSVTTSPLEREGRSSYFDSAPNLVPPPKGQRRPAPPPRSSSYATSESLKTVRPYGSSPSSWESARFGERQTSGRMPGSSHIYGLFGGAYSHSHGQTAKGLHSERSSELATLSPSRTRSLDEDRHSGASLALTTTPAIGKMENEALWQEGWHGRVGDRDPAVSERSRHANRRSESLAYESSIESFHLTRESLLRKRRSDLEPTIDNNHPLPARTEGTRKFSNDVANSREVTRSETINDSISGGEARTEPVDIGASRPSAGTVSSSSVDDYASGRSPNSSFSQASADFDSGAGENGISKVKTQDTARRIPRPGSRDSNDDDYDNEEDSSDDSEDDGLIFMGKMRSSNHGES